MYGVVHNGGLNIENKLKFVKGLRGKIAIFYKKCEKNKFFSFFWSFFMRKKELTAEDVWAMFAETDKKINALREQIGGISNSNGEFAEEFFYNSLKKTMIFAGVHYEYISNQFNRGKVLPDKTEIKAQFDIVLHNGNAIALIEAKYKANLKDIKEMVEKKVPNFRLLYPEYAKYKLYLGIGSLVLKDRVVDEAKKLGIGLMRQQGNAVEYKTDWVRAY